MKTTIRLLCLFTLVAALLLFWQYRHPSINLKPISYAELPQWDATDLKQSFKTFKGSCAVFLKRSPSRFVGSRVLNLHVSDWLSACREAVTLKSPSKQAVKQFFEDYFVAVEISHKEAPLKGLFTGYYVPELNGSLKKTKRYHVPIYGVPSDLVTLDLSLFDNLGTDKRIKIRIDGNKAYPYFTRKAINRGAIKGKSKVIAWVDSVFDRFNLEIQGSGIIRIKNGRKKLYLGYASENGQPYSSIAKTLIDKGVMTRDNASMQRIRRYLELHPKQKETILHTNKSFVFFRRLKEKMALGAQGINLTAGYSLAVDRRYIPLGVPIWLTTTHPKLHAAEKKSALNRLMIAQDTGGAIRGLVRGDFFWGAGKKAEFIAGHMKNAGHYWLLLPRDFVSQQTWPIKVSL